MKNYLKTSMWLRWATAGVFGVMLVLNIMVSLEFEKDKILPSITLVELGNMAMAQGESGGGDYGYMCCPGTVACTDESGQGWLEDRKVLRTKPGDTCTNH